MSDLLIPRHISRKGLYSANFVIANSIVSYYYDYRALSTLLFVLYITTLLHWNRLYRKSWIKTFDIIFAVSSILSVTLRDSRHFTPENADIWNKSISISIMAFVLNEYLLYYYLDQSKESTHHQSVNTHILFLHILPNVTCMYCIMMS